MARQASPCAMLAAWPILARTLRATLIRSRASIRRAPLARGAPFVRRRARGKRRRGRDERAVVFVATRRAAPACFLTLRPRTCPSLRDGVAVDGASSAIAAAGAGSCRHGSAAGPRRAGTTPEGRAREGGGSRYLLRGRRPRPVLDGRVPGGAAPARHGRGRPLRPRPCRTLMWRGGGPPWCSRPGARRSARSPRAHRPARARGRRGSLGSPARK